MELTNALILCSKDCARLDWAVLKVCMPCFLFMRHWIDILLEPIHQWNQPSINFYEKTLGASALSEWVGMRLEEGGIEGLKKFVDGIPR